MVHRDIKPENLLIDKDFRLIIADFNFATRLARTHTSMLAPTFDPTVKRDISVGSVAYNAPELWEIEQRVSEIRQRGHHLD